MRVLADVTATPEQLKIICINPTGTILIRGAAGSGKTTTALLRLKYLTEWWTRQRKRTGITEPVRILVLTYNRTLRGYVEALAEHQVTQAQSPMSGAVLEVDTLSGLSRRLLGMPNVLNLPRALIETYGETISLEPRFLVEETAYALGRFLPDNLEEYIECRRVGRGATPRVDKELRKRILSEVIVPYTSFKQSNGRVDWNDLAIELAQNKVASYDVIVVDEAQDFSANQVRAIRSLLAPTHSLTLVLDAAQRIYAHSFLWREVGIKVTPTNTYRLERNYRNTLEIARFAAPLLNGLDVTDDGTLPDFTACTRHGPKPILLVGKFSAQMRFAIQRIRDTIDTSSESVAFLHPKGGGWFDEVRRQLKVARMGFVELTRASEWPQSDDNIGLSTLHSSKGLEFDHVYILGLSAELTPHGVEEGDDEMEKLRRLLAMAIGRARKSIVIGYKPEEASSLIDLLDPDTYEECHV